MHSSSWWPIDPEVDWWIPSRDGPKMLMDHRSWIMICGSDCAWSVETLALLITTDLKKRSCSIPTISKQKVVVYYVVEKGPFKSSRAIGMDAGLPFKYQPWIVVNIF